MNRYFSESWIVHLLALASPKALSTVAALIFLTTVTACTDPEGPREQDEPHFAIYLPADTNTKIMDWFGQDYDSLEIDQTPWLTDSDLLLYDFSGHVMYLDGTRSDFLDYSTNNPGMFDVSWCDRPFLVVANGARLYPGRFSCSLSPSPPVVLPEISDLSDGLQPANILRLEWTWLFHNDDDSRGNEQVRSALVDAGIYHAGMNIDLDSLTHLGGNEHSAIQYTFTITNNDVDDLFVPDPALMGDSLYHFWTNGLACYSLDTGEYHQRLFEDDGIDFRVWDSSWYTRLPSGESLTRTTVVSRIRLMTPGDYSCVITYGVPSLISESELSRTDGRYWLGHMFSEAVGVTFASADESTAIVNGTTPIAMFP